MLQKLKLEHILFLDIETVPEHAAYDQLDETLKPLWENKTRYQRKDQFSPEEFYDRAGIWAEFGKIICISVGFFKGHGSDKQFRIKSFSGEEAEILKDFKELLQQHFSRRQHLLCAHNGKEFDFPFIARRMIIHGIELPSKLNLFGKKPWEVAHLDTMELWKFGDYKHYTSLKLLANILGIPSPKEDIDGSQVRQVYYEEGALSRIVEYCQRDTLTVAQIILKLRGDALLEEDQIAFI